MWSTFGGGVGSRRKVGAGAARSGHPGSGVESTSGVDGRAEEASLEKRRGADGF